MKIVVVKSDRGLSEQGLLEHCRQHRNGDEIPRAIEYRTELLPKTNLGKILRRQLRDESATAHCAMKR